MTTKSKNYLVGMGVFLLIVAICIFAFGCDNNGGSKNPNAGLKPADQELMALQKVEQTPKGAYIHSANGTTDALKAEADASLTELFTDAKAAGYSKHLNYSDYTILVLDTCQPSPEMKVPSFRTEDGGWAAEQVLMNGRTPSFSYKVCNTSGDYFKDSVRFGPEHIILFHNDPEKYGATYQHQYGGQPHPLIDRTTAK